MYNLPCSMRRRPSICMLSVCLLILQASHGFIFVPARLTTTTAAASQKITALSVSSNSRAQKQLQGKSGRGGGFGTSATKPFTAASGISGHSGSGTKVLRKAANNFDRIRKEFGQDQETIQRCCRDVYVRSILNSPTTFWFVGKIAREPLSTTKMITNPTDPDEEDLFFAQAALAQKRLIFDYSKDQLRPTSLGGKYAATLELWLAPGDSEMDVATNKVALTPVRGNAADLPRDWNANAVGYNPEIYIGDEVHKGGLRVQRDEHGMPTKAAFDVNNSM